MVCETKLPDTVLNVVNIDAQLQGQKFEEILRIHSHKDSRKDINKNRKDSRKFFLKFSAVYLIETHYPKTQDESVGDSDQKHFTQWKSQEIDSPMKPEHDHSTW